MSQYRGLVVTGPRGAGKSAIAASLAKVDPRFAVCEAVTTRGPRADDGPHFYEYLSNEEFEAESSLDGFLVAVNYEGSFYAIRRRAVDRLLEQGLWPVLVVAPRCVEDTPTLGSPVSWTAEPPTFMSFFIDAPDVILDRRLSARESSGASEVMQNRQRGVDRSFRSRCIYSIENAGHLDEVVELVREVWRTRGHAGILTGRTIGKLVAGGVLLENASASRVSGASYDLALGDEYYYGGRIHYLTRERPFLLVEPYDYAIVTSHERANFPSEVAGRFDLSVSLFCQGVILSNGPQVDPGFRGPLFCLLFNTSNSPVLLKRRQHYATLEFHRLVEPVSRYQGEYQGKDLLHYLPGTVAQGAINELKKDLETVRGETRRLQEMTWAVLSLVIALLALFLVLS